MLLIDQPEVSNMVSKSSPIRAWHFVGETLRDGSPIPRDGKWLDYAGRIELCASGLHASRLPSDALHYAHGGTLCLVDCAGEVIESSDKLVCSSRRIVVRMDADRMLRHFARQQALSVIHLAPDMDQCVYDYLMGDDAARGAAGAAAWDAARGAAGAAAWAAARAAAWAAAWGAARGAARGAAWDAARGAFDAMVHDAFADWI